MAAAKNLVQFMKAFELLSRPGGISISKLQEELGISRRSVYRLFESFEELGYPLVDHFIDGKSKRWGMMEEFIASRPSGSVPRLSLNTGEIMILYQILSRQTPLYESGMKKTILSLRNRLEQFYLDNEGEGITGRFKDIFINTPGQYKHLEGKEEIYQTLLTGALEKRVCKGVYKSFRKGENRKTEFSVLCFFEWNYGLYCFTRRTEDRGIRTMALERFVSAELTDRKAPSEQDFHPESLLERAWGLIVDDPIKVVIRFSPAVAPYIREREWNRDQKIVQETGGSLLLKLTTSGRRDIKGWVFSFGRDAQLLEPQDLRDEMKKELLETTMAYR